MSSPNSADGISVLNPLTSIVLRDLDDFTSLTNVSGTAVAGFGAMREVVFEVQVSSVSLTGGSNPTVTLTVWIQRQLPSGGWDDLMAFALTGLTSGQAAVSHAGDVQTQVGTAGNPAAAQDAGGSPPFAQRGRWISDSLRWTAKLTVTGTPTAQTVTWRLLARGR